MNAIFLVLLCAAQPVDLGVPERHPASADQVLTPDEARTRRTEQVGTAEPADVAVDQLPDTIDLPGDAAGPEAGLAAVPPERPRDSLYLEVANAWEMIRRRGQQPTPELIAREIGPDMLARFLNQFPGSESMFGKDSDRLPVAPPSLPPDGR